MRVRPLHVVGFHREQFLQGVSRAVRFERPDFHLAETLAAVLRLAAERLLRDERVRTNRAGVNLVRHQMAQLHHVDVTDDHFLIEGVARPAVIEPRLAGFLHPGEALLSSSRRSNTRGFSFPRFRRKPASRP